MIFRQLQDAESNTYTYLIGDESTREAVIVDSVLPHHERDIQLLGQLQLKLAYALETHVHADHVTGAGKLREVTGCKGIVPEHANVGCADRFMHDGETLRLGSITITAITTPGHTDAHLAYRVNDDRVLTGDALFIRGCGRTDFQGGDAGRLYDSVTQRLFTLAEETLVYPGHDYRGHTVSTIGEEKRCNTRFAGRDRKQFVEFMTNLKLPMPQKIMEALPANEHCGILKTLATTLAGGAKGQVQPIQAAQLETRLAKADAMLIDVREAGEFAREHIAGAQSLPLSTLDAAKLMRDKPLIVYCDVGSRSHDAAERLSAAGFEVLHLTDGMNAWQAAGLPTEVDPSQPIPVTRQVQIIAGTLVVLGVVLAALVSPWCLLLSAFVGGGLLFAGLSGNCMMALLLSKLAYNRVRRAPQSSRQPA